MTQPNGGRGYSNWNSCCQWRCLTRVRIGDARRDVSIAQLEYKTSWLPVRNVVGSDRARFAARTAPWILRRPVALAQVVADDQNGATTSARIEIVTTVIMISISENPRTLMRKF